MSLKVGTPVSSIALAAVNWGQHEAKRLVRFKQGRTNEAPSWEGRGGDITTNTTNLPITDQSYWVGRYVLCPLTLEGVTKGGDKITVEFPDAVAAVSRERHIVSTGLVGRNGTVKEYINEGDWQVNIVVGVQAVRDGVIADEWPGDELREVRRLLEVEESLAVYSEFLDVFNIGRLVIKSYTVTQGTEANYQEVNISAVSDEDYEIFSKEYEQPKEEAKQ